MPLKPRSKALYRGILESHLNPTFGVLVLDNNPCQLGHASKVNRTFEPVRATAAEIVGRLLAPAPLSTDPVGPTLARELSEYPAGRNLA